MAEKTQTLQESFLKLVCKEAATVTVFLKSGICLTGAITVFDGHCVLLSTEAQSQLVYKHAIATLVPPPGLRPPIRNRDIQGGT